MKRRWIARLWRNILACDLRASRRHMRSYVDPDWGLPK
jgi:hypothetical protein